jgi:hypothetical protein
MHSVLHFLDWHLSFNSTAIRILITSLIQTKGKFLFHYYNFGMIGISLDINFISGEYAWAFGPHFRGEDGSFASLRPNGSLDIALRSGEYARAFSPRLSSEDESFAFLSNKN